MVALLHFTSNVDRILGSRNEQRVGIEKGESADRFLLFDE
jgi:hypothetical protein